MESNFNAVLVLEDGTIFKGKAAGMQGIATGEICFNTGMTGYQEIFTDPSYNGQVMVTTNAHIGNYGIMQKERESEKVQISGLICKNFTNDYSRPLADQDIQKYFEENNIVCIYGLDTRAIVKHVRDKGAMNCIISSEIDDVEELKKRLSKVPSMAGLELASKVCTNEEYTMGDPDSNLKIAVYDFGTKKNILRCFVDRGAYVKVFPAKTDLSVLKEFNPDGYFLSNGPGDPEPMGYAVKNVKEILELEKPVFGICLGHQILARAMDIPTYKMHHGHRGINHPVKNIASGKCEITSQNHGFGVSPEALKKHEDKIEVTHINLNDDTVEGIRIKGKPAFSVQYHPEAAPGPHDSRYLFDEFIELVKNNK
jgi:carbamoyl-phosphate synthase small subunit